MSTTYTAQVVCGFIIEIIAHTEQRQKYDVNTGEPYNIDEPIYNVAMVDGVEIGSTVNDPYAFSCGEFLDGLEFGLSGYADGLEGQDWLGKVVAGGSECYWDMFSQFRTDVPEEVKAFAAKHGLTPRWFISMSIG